MAGEKPAAAFVLSLIGGIFLLIGGSLQAYIGAVLAPLIPGLGVGLIAGAVIVFLLVLLGAVMLYVRPQQHVMWGVIVLVFSILGFIFNLVGGFLIGSILGIVGGALGIAFKPGPMMAPPPASPQM